MAVRNRILAAAVDEDEFSSGLLDELVKMLEKSIRRKRLPKCLRNHEQQLRHKPLINNNRIRLALRWFNILVIKFLSGIHQINLERSYDSTRLTFRAKCRRILNEFKTVWRKPTWKVCLSIVIIVQAYITFRLATILYHQYSYDFNQLKRKKLIDRRQREIMEVSSSHSPFYSDFEAELDSLETRIVQSEESLREIGAPHMEWGIIIECIYLYVLKASFFTLVMIPTYVNFSRCVHSAWARYFLNPVSEVQARAELILEQVNEYIKSSRAYTRSQLVTLLAGVEGRTKCPIKWHLAPVSVSMRQQRRMKQESQKEDDQAKDQEKEGPHERKELEEEDEGTNGELGELAQKIDTTCSRVLLLRHRSSCQQVKSLALRGELNPLVDRSDAWLDWLAVLNISLSLIISIYWLIWTLFLYAKCSQYFEALGRHVRLESYGEQLTFWLFVVELVLLLMSSCFLGQLGVLSYLDIIRPLEALRVMILETIKQNEITIKQLSDELERMIPYERDLMMIQWRLAASTANAAAASSTAIDHHGNHHSLVSLLNHHNSFIPFGVTLHGTSMIRRNNQMFSVASEIRHRRGRRKVAADQLSELWSEGGPQQQLFKLMESIEVSTMTCLLQYKCFCVEFYRMKHSYETFVFIYMYLAALLPVIARLHIPYLADFRARTCTVYMSVAAAIPAFLATLPCAFIHCRCLSIYKALWSLLSQLVHLEAKHITRDYLNIGHEISLLRKELTLPEEFSHKFACRLMGLMDLTYPNLLRVHFGISLLTLSMLFNISLMGDSVMKGFLADPFGVLTSRRA